MVILGTRRSTSEVNRVGCFLCGYRDCLFCPVVGIYQGVGTPLGGPSGIRNSGSRGSVLVRISDVRIASTGKILRW